MAQQDLDSRPGQVYDPESDGAKPHPESLEKRNSPADEAAFDQIAAGNRDLDGSGPNVKNAEQNATTNDGNATAASKDEKGLMPGGGAPWANNTLGKTKSGGALGNNKVKILIATFMITLLVGVGGVVFILPGLAVKSVMAKSTEFFMDRISYTTERRVERLIGGYFTRMIVGPSGSIERCGTYISANCFATDPGNSIVGNLYKNWSESRLEERLNKRYGLEIVKNTRSNQIEVWKTNSAGIRGQVGIYGDNTVARELSKLVKNETRWPQVRDRLGVRSLLAGRYGAAKWCFIACEKKDSLDQSRINALTKAKLKIASRILTPVNARQTAIILCLISDCSDTETSQAMRDAVKAELGDADVDLTEIQREITGVDGDSSRGSSISEYYLKKFIIKVLTNFIGDVSAKAAASYVPIAGQIYAGATIVDLFDSLDQKVEDKSLSKHIKEVNESAYVEYFSIMQASSDEVFSGESALQDIGAMSTILSGSNKSRVYQKANNSGRLSTVECDDGVVLSGPTDPLACPEKSVQPKFFLEEWRQNSVVSGILDLANTYDRCIGPTVPGTGDCPQGDPKRYIKPILTGINWVVGGVASVALGAIERIPIIGDFVQSAQSFVADKAAELVGWISEKAFKNVINPDAEGQEAFDQLAAGMDVSANIFAKGETTEDGETIGLGGTRLTEQQEVELAEAINAHIKEKRKDESFFARYFDVQNPNSLASTAIVAAAQGVTEDSSFGSAFSLSTVSNIFRSIFPAQNTYASGIVNRQEVFDVYQYGYAEDDPNLNIPLEELTVERCAELDRLREETHIIDPETQQKIYTQSNPCMMDEILGVSLTKLENLDDPSDFTNGTPTSPGGSGLVSAEGYAFPLEPQTKAVGGINNAHHDGTPAFDLFSSTPDPDVYAISDGTVDTVNTNFNDVSGCTSIQFRSVDGFWYWHGHLKNPVVQRGDVVRAGDKLAEVADASFGSRCVGGAPHLHIDRGCVRNGVPQRGGTDACRDPDFIPFLRAIWEGLPNG